jgi:hypothetical protein
MTAPLTPPDADLQDFPFMPLHVARLRDSDLAAEGHPEGCWYAVLLWAAAWHQIPAGSLPDNDAVLARLCGLGRDLRTFKKRRDDALRGFVLCDDGRLYHPVVAEQVVTSWQGKLEQRHRTECARIKKANQRNDTDHACPSFEEFVSSNFPGSVPFVSLGTSAQVPRDNGSKGKGERKGQGEGDNNKEEAQAPEPPSDGDGKSYAFSGETVRLNELDLARWRKTYHAIADLDAELMSIDGWWQNQTEAKRKGWFHSTQGMLNRKHQEALSAAKRPQNDDYELPIA